MDFHVGEYVEEDKKNKIEPIKPGDYFLNELTEALGRKVNELVAAVNKINEQLNKER